MNKIEIKRKKNNLSIFFTYIILILSLSYVLYTWVYQSKLYENLNWFDNFEPWLIIYWLLFAFLIKFYINFLVCINKITSKEDC